MVPASLVTNNSEQINSNINQKLNGGNNTKEENDKKIIK